MDGCYSLGATLCFLMDFFCLQMAILPAYEYMVVHLTLGILATVVMGITRDSKGWERPLWVIFAALCSWWFLTVHHWLTTPASIITTESIVVDARVSTGGGELPMIDAEIDEEDDQGWMVLLRMLMFFLTLVGIACSFIT